MSNNYLIKEGKDCWGSMSYMGYKGKEQITDAFDDITELTEWHPEFKNCPVKYSANKNL